MGTDVTISDHSHIYLDHNATTPVAPESINAMMPYLKEEFGNPSSNYPLGIRAREGVEKARKDVADLIGCDAVEVIFTSGGSESNNMVLKGSIDFNAPTENHIITSAVEHPAVLNPLFFLMELGVKVSILPVDRFGRVDPDDVKKALSPATKLISVMLANNETGTIQPVKEIAEIARKNNVPVHTDAAQAVGKIPVDVNELGVDFLSLAGHKLYAPKGIGALYLRNGSDIRPLIHGADQEHGKRAGTENVVLSVGLGTACKVARERLNEDIRTVTAMRERLQVLLVEGIKDLVINGHIKDRLPNTLSVSVPNMDGAKILADIPGLYASTGAACHDRKVKLSRVLAAMAVPPEIGMGTIRLSLGRNNTMDQIEEAARMICASIKKARSHQ
ncbi:MAG: cysteine desulfurase [Deltaproteobacteria bacterium]|nr:cysteine desulfurase [Deltaproteobacteria bacterium]